MELKERLDVFKNELKLIANKKIKDFTIACINAAPDYVFEDCPSSSSGKFHPVDELCADGTIIHTKRVFTVAYELSRGFDCELHRDEICAAALLHDMAKQGLVSKGHTVKDHPQIMAKLVADVYNDGFKSILDKNSANIIYWSIFYHYGPWHSDEATKKPITMYTPEELCVYISDYISSKRFITVDHIRKEGLIV